MKDRRQLHLWTVLARVRQLRVERGRRRLSEAREQVRRAAAETAQREAALAAHAARRGEIVAACARGNVAAALWRLALRRHDGEKPALEAELAGARGAQQAAQDRVRPAVHALQKGTMARDEAREQVRQLRSAVLDQGEADD